MTTLLEIKPIIHDFIQENLDESFGDKIYWIGERVEEPDYPYCMLTELNENKDKRTSYHYGDLVDNKRQNVTTRYKTAVITIGIYNAFVTNSYEDMDMDEAKEFAYEQIDLLEALFENRYYQDLFYPHFSIIGIGNIRPLPSPISGGYEYRYEFDLNIGYNEPVTTTLDIGEGIITDINKEYDHNSDNADNTINFEIDTTTQTVWGRIINK